ncbi:hypothetical protein [Flaviaesturariibacter amylovorans]|uniref:Uncharacterized protein n=1 Tax=Flaviaesturariibacter amylovorans TaxID=1084520 RepID=A0ABP8HI98_9BACT
MVNIVAGMRVHPSFQEKYQNNPDVQNRDLALKAIFEDVMRGERKKELDLYRLLASDDAFKQAMLDTLKRMLAA